MWSWLWETLLPYNIIGKVYIHYELSTSIILKYRINNPLIVEVIFQAKLWHICWLELLQCEDLLLFFVINNSRWQKSLWVWTASRTKVDLNVCFSHRLVKKKLSTESVVFKIVLKCYIILSPFCISLPDDPPSCDILQHVTQGKENPPHSFQLAGCFRHWVLVQDLLLHTQSSIVLFGIRVKKIIHGQKGKSLVSWQKNDT